MKSFTDYLAEAKSADRVIFSVMGPHAGEGVDDIFKRKIADIQKIGYTLWLHRSSRAKPDFVQTTCDGNPMYVLFLGGSSVNAAQPTKVVQKASHFSVDCKEWTEMPKHLGPVTGKMAKAHAFKFDLICLKDPGDMETIDLWKYQDNEHPGEPIRFRLGASTLCARRGDASASPKKMKSRLREVLAVAKLCDPYAVWLKSEC